MLKGDNFVVMIYWYGKVFNEWVNNWVKYYLDGKGEYVMMVMEDIGML